MQFPFPHTTPHTLFGTLQVRIWDANEYNVICAGHAGFPVTGITYSNERYRCSLYNDDKKWVQGLR